MPRSVMTFREFQASKKEEPVAAFVARTSIDPMDDDAETILSYGPSNDLWICGLKEESDFPYSLTLERDYWDGYCLEQLERRLYEWAVAYGCCDLAEAAHG
jgi:hypothetical protein